LHGTAAAVSSPWVAAAFVRAAEDQPANSPPARPAFTAEGNEFHFDTGALRGTLRSQGKSLGLSPVVDSASGTTIARAYGLFSHYRLLSADARYGHAAWDWGSAARLLPDGSVEALWTADAEHPLDLKAVYRWAAPNALDVTTTVTAKQELKRLESFLASYFEALPTSLVYVKGCPETGGKPGFLEAKPSYAVWQMFPRDEEAVKTIQDGRWTRPPNPVDWKIMPALAGPLAMRRDAASGLAGLVMARPEDCFAVSTPSSGEGHRSIYLSLLGGDLAAGQSATARSRLVIAHGISDEQAIGLYEAYLKEVQGA